jgi:hypothetical protein
MVAPGAHQHELDVGGSVIAALPFAEDQTAEEQISALLRSPRYRAWREQTEATGGCLRPVHLSGRWALVGGDGTVLVEESGVKRMACNNRRASACPPCSARYESDAYHLLTAGLAGGKDITREVAEHPRALVTLTAPGFGPVHTRRETRRGRIAPCNRGAGCTQQHREHDPILGTAVDAARYDYRGAALWQAHAGELWRRFTISLRRAVARELGVREHRLVDVCRVSYAKVAEFQKRGLVHLHAVIRLDGPEGPDDPAPPGADVGLIARTVRAAVQATTVTTPDSLLVPARVLSWGRQVDVRPITADTLEPRSDSADTGEWAGSRVAGYIAKYATKDTGTTDGADTRIRSATQIDMLPISKHHRQMMRACWEIGGLPEFAHLNLRAWTHMLGFRGHFLTKSRRYSVTFAQIRGARTAYRRAQLLEHLGLAPDDADQPIVVINDWAVTGIGHRNAGERELAEAIAGRQMAHRGHGGDDDG